jgi:hypothetical protein
MGPVRCPEMSVNNYHSTPRNIPEENRSDQHRCGSLKSRMLITLPVNVSTCTIYLIHGSTCTIDLIHESTCTIDLIHESGAFDLQSGDVPYWARFLMALLSISRQLAGWCLKLGHDSVLPRPFKSIIHQWSHHPTLLLPMLLHKLQINSNQGVSRVKGRKFSETFL